MSTPLSTIMYQSDYICIYVCSKRIKSHMMMKNIIFLCLILNFIKYNNLI